MKKKNIRLGLIGCGSFGQFCLKAFSRMAEIEIAGVADLNETVARHTAAQFQTKWYPGPESLIGDKQIDLVHLVTPPHSHFSLGVLAASEGKHVLCEKPLALTLAEGKTMLEAARRRQVLMPVNFVLRYVPLVDMVKKLIEQQILGQPLRAYFENYATDHNLDPSHWFWDKNQSGGIFIEHGVHFFDLYRYWLGDAEIQWSQTQIRQPYQQEDRVFCAMRHQSGVLSTHYHGFDQPAMLDRQVHRILFEKGDVTVHGWIPESATIQALVDTAGLEELKTIFPGGNIEESHPLPDQAVKARGKMVSAGHLIRMTYTSPQDKLTLYRDAIIRLLRDQIQAIHDRQHQRVISEENGLKALDLAVQATEISAGN